MKRWKICAALLALLLAFAVTGCAPANDAQFQAVFGQSASELIPTVGNSAYSARSLGGEEEADDSGEASSDVQEAAQEASDSAEDTYVDPTAGLDCSED